MLVLLRHFCSLALGLKRLDSHVLDLVYHFRYLAIQLWLGSILELGPVLAPSLRLHLQVVAD